MVSQKVINASITIFGLLLACGLYGFMMYGLYDFNDLRISEGDDSLRDSEFQFVGGTGNATLRDISHKLGTILWETKAIDLIVLGILLLVASEAAATVVKGISEQCAEFREICDTDKFLALEEQEKEQEEGV